MPKKIGFARYEENFPGSDFTPDEWEFLQAMRAYQLKTCLLYTSRCV